MLRFAPPAAVLVAPAPPTAAPWWETRAYAALLIALMAVPLLWPAVPPLADLPGHIGRYRIQLDIARSPYLHQWFEVHWALMGNLGMDVAMIPLGRLLGVEPAVKLLVALIPPAGTAGYLLIAREAHGRVPPTAAFALPLLYGYPFHFGFINFAMGTSLALLAFGLWLRMARLGQIKARAALFVPLSFAVWVAHASGWAILVLGCAAAEMVRAHRAGHALWKLPLVGFVACLPLVPTLLVMLFWHGSGVAGATYGWFDLGQKAGWIESALRDRWKRIDGDMIELLALLVGLGAVRLLRFEPLLLAVTALLGLVYLLMPETLLGAHYADMRMAPVLVAFAVLALAPRPHGPRWIAPALAIAAALFFVVRTGATTASLALFGQEQARQLEAVPHIPRGSRVYVMVAPPCPRGWAAARLDHMGSMAIVRREAFTNDQWAEGGAQTLAIKVPLAEEYRLDPAQIVRLPGCDRPEPLLADRLAHFPRAAFDHVWLVNVPAAARPTDPGLRLVWANDVTALYRIIRS